MIEINTNNNFLNNHKISKGYLMRRREYLVAHYNQNKMDLVNDRSFVV